jgi:hypothetical protein
MPQMPVQPRDHEDNRSACHQKSRVRKQLVALIDRQLQIVAER